MVFSLFLTTADMLQSKKRERSNEFRFSLFVANQMTVKGKNKFAALE